MGDHIVTLSSEEEKALLTDTITIQAWVDNLLHNKARQCIDTVCTEALNDQTNTILTTGEKETVAAALANTGQILATVKQMPVAIKYQIVSLARVKSAAQKQAEWEASLVGNNE